MHIPDGFLDIRMIAITFAITIIFWIVASVKFKGALGEKQVPLLALVTAGVFAAQMVNFPILGGTSGHLVGATLISILFGPYAAIVSITTILLIQGFMFGDGGITALGANVLNMGIVAAFSGYLIYKAITRLHRGTGVTLASAFVASWVSIVLGAFVCGLEIGFSSIFPYGIGVTVPVMVVWHVIIGLGEGIITVLILAALMRAQPSVLPAMTNVAAEKKG
ncbi:MAG: energy-coupling factor ABC transporter permease [Candidatus Atabeyarchaeum deiterrae]